MTLSFVYFQCRPYTENPSPAASAVLCWTPPVTMRWLHTVFNLSFILKRIRSNTIENHRFQCIMEEWIIVIGCVSLTVFSPPTGECVLLLSVLGVDQLSQCSTVSPIWLPGWPLCAASWWKTPMCCWSYAALLHRHLRLHEHDLPGEHLKTDADLFTVCDHSQIRAAVFLKVQSLSFQGVRGRAGCPHVPSTSEYFSFSPSVLLT